MLKLFFSLLLVTLATGSQTLAADTGSPQPALCQDYTLTESPVDPAPRSRESIPYGQGLLWKIEGDNGQSPSYLFGTMHSQDRKVTSLPPQVRLALVQSKRLVMEVLLEPEAFATFNEAVYDPAQPDLNTLLDPEIYHRLSEIIPEYGIPPEKLAKLKPWAAFSIIGRPRPVQADTQENVLMQIAMTANKPMTGIETMQELTSVLDKIGLADQIIILNDTVCNHKEIIRKTRDLVDMYVNRDLAGIVLFNEEPHYDEAVFQRFMQGVLYGRNQRMLDRIEPHLQEGGAFIAIGASHLPDEKGLLKMLEQKGYKISLVY